MEAFDKSLNNKTDDSVSVETNPDLHPNTTSVSSNNTTYCGEVISNKTIIRYNSISTVKKRFIAFDVETTGLSSTNDKIIEVGAVLFENGIPISRFGSLINIHSHIPSSATAVNNITDEMIASAPDEAYVYAELVDFFGDALNEQTIICAHNASFDMSFLCAALKRMGYDGKIKYADTLSLLKRLVIGLPYYRLNIVAAHFGISNPKSHRAVSDAEVCGKIFNELIKLKEAEWQRRIIANEAKKLNDDEKEICAAIQKIIFDKGGDIKYLGFDKRSSNYIDVLYVYSFLRFKIAKKGKYIIVKKSAVSRVQLPIEQCTMSEGGTDNVRVFIKQLSDLEALSTYIYKCYIKCKKTADKYITKNEYREEYLDSTAMFNSISVDEMMSILQSIENNKE